MVALKLDFGDVSTLRLGPHGAILRLAPKPRGLRGPDKYKVLEHRRRQAQIRARRVLGL
jgi:hypothetical protein